MKFILPQGTGTIKKSKSYESLKPNQKKVYDIIYDSIQGPLEFAKNCTWVVRNGLEQYHPFDYQREMIFNLHHYKDVISLFSRQNGKCVYKKTKLKVANKKTGEIKEISINQLFNIIKDKNL